LVDAPGGPCVNRWVYVAKLEFVGGNLSAWMHVPFAEQKNELFFREVRIETREGDHVEREIPGGVPGELPLIRHGDDVAVVEVDPVGIAAFPARRRRRGVSGIAFEPLENADVVKLLGPEQAGVGVPGDFEFAWRITVDAEEEVRFEDALIEDGAGV